MISGARSPATSGCSRSDRVNGRRRMVAAVWAAALAVGAVLTPHPAAAAGLHGVRLDWPWALPFAGLLLSIATGPLLFPRIWHGHYGKIAFMWSALTLVPLAALRGIPVAVAGLVHAMLAEYLSFIVLLFALYVVAGGILVTGNLRGTPWVNAAILGLGTLMASIVGTTGAAMILIRPLLRANAARLVNVHVVVFFIFLVANIGGALSPLGDPPLFVGFLRGVDFFWTTRHLAFTTALTAGIVLALENLVRDGALIVIALASVALTPDEHREANGFSWEPIREVAYLFAGIFACIIPVLATLAAGPSGSFAWLLDAVTMRDGGPNDAAYFWLTGVLSALLDNAPTYLVFFELAGGDAGRLMGELGSTLAAISMGAVFMGALSYIGNAPNFMIYAIATERGIKMPSFFGYLLWSCAVLLPVFVLLTYVSVGRP